MHKDVTRAQFDAFKAPPRDTRIEMRNLIRPRDRSLHGDGGEATGAEAYAAHGREGGPTIRHLRA